jgi:hypothetical protein
MIPSEILILVTSLVISIALVAVLWVVLIRLGRQARNQTVGSERPGRQRAQLEDLESKDISFLVEHPALATTIIRELQGERRRLLREYLRSLRYDFNLTCAAIKAAIVASSQDRPDLVETLFKQQVRFKLRLMWAECSMIIEAIGLVAVDSDTIIDALDVIRLDVTRLVATVQHKAG